MLSVGKYEMFIQKILIRPKPFIRYCRWGHYRALRVCPGWFKWFWEMEWEV